MANKACPPQRPLEVRFAKAVGSISVGPPGPQGPEGPPGPAGVSAEPLYDAGPSGSGSVVLDVEANGPAQLLTLTGNAAISFTVLADLVDTFTIILEQGGAGGYVPTWAGVTWAAGVTPTPTPTLGVQSIYTFFSDGEGTIYGAASTVIDYLAARSVLGRAVGTAGAMAAIAAGSGSGYVLRESGGSIGFGTILGVIVEPDFGDQDVVTTGFVQLGLDPGAGSGVASAAASGLVRMPRGNNILIGLRNDGDTADFEGLRWNSSSGALTFGSTNTQTRMNAGTLVSLQIGGTDRFYVTSTRLESTLSFYFKDTATGATIGQVARTGSSAGSRVTYSGQNTVDGAAGPATLQGGSASDSGTGGDAEVRPGTSGSGTAGSAILYSAAGTKRLEANNNGVGFNGGTPAVPNITGSRGGNAALADLLTKLATLGLITDGSSA